MKRTRSVTAMAIAALAGSAIAEDRQPNTKDIQILAQDSSGRTLALASNPVKTARGSLPRADELVFGSGFSGTINQTSLNATWNFRYTTMSDGLLISNFKFRQAPTRSAQQLGLGNVNDFAVLFASYFAQFPDADYAVAWVETGTAVASGLSASFTSTNTLPRTLYPFMPCSDQVPMRLTASGGPLGDGIAGLYIDGIVSDLQICVAADCDDDGCFPSHAFVVLIDENGVRRGRGKYPFTKSGIFYGPGNIRDDSTRHCTNQLCFRVTTEQYNRAVAYMNSQQQGGSAYSLIFDNCLDFARATALAAGLSLPAATGRGGAEDPRELRRAIQLLTAPTMNCGVARPCASRDAEASYNRASVPLSWGSLGAWTLRLTSGAVLIADIVCVLYKNEYPPLLTEVSPGGTVTLDRTGIPEGEFFAFIDWGDGSDHFDLSLSATHTYNTPGTYQVRQWIQEDGALHEQHITVVVSPSAASSRSVLTTPVDNEPAADIPNPGFEIMSDIPLIPVASCQTDCNTNSIPDCDEPHPVAGLDCNLNGVLDACDISNGVSLDSNLDGICDECQQVACLGDANSDGNVNFADITNSLENWGATYPPTIGAGPGDADDDGVVNFGDITAVLQTWGSSCNL